MSERQTDSAYPWQKDWQSDRRSHVAKAGQGAQAGSAPKVWREGGRQVGQPGEMRIELIGYSVPVLGMET